VRDSSGEEEADAVPAAFSLNESYAASSKRKRATGLAICIAAVRVVDASRNKQQAPFIDESRCR